MTVLRRQMITGTIFAAGFLIIFSILFFATFPVHDWSLLWTRQVWHLPFVFIVPILSLFLGLVTGFISGNYWRGVLRSIDDSLTELTPDKPGNKADTIHLEEAQSILQHLERLRGQMAEQTQLAQKMASEKSAIEEKAIQKIVSDERNRLARELHDSVSQQLFAASMLMSTINELRPPSDDTETRQLRLVEQTIHQSQLEMRALFLHLRPAQLHGKQLREGIEELLNELRQKVPMTINWTIEQVSLDKGIEDQIFRILQESVSNTLRHAKAETLDVMLIRREKTVIMRITDDGIGFHPDTAKPGSYGLQNIRERAAQIGAQLKLVSVPGKGTSLEIKVPILKGDESSD